MSPEQVKVSIHKEYRELMQKVNAGEIPENSVYSVIESRCREGATHNGIPSYWREYLPRPLR